METQTKTEPVGAEQAGMRLDAFVAEKAGVSRSAAQGWIEQELVLIDGKPAVKNRRLRAGEAVSVTVPEPVEYAAQPENIPLDIVYEDRDLLVVNKPQGMVVHPAAGHLSGTLVNALLYHAKGRLSAINGVVRPGIVHRIDRDTSGILVVAKTNAAHLSLAEQIKEHSVHRAYLCIAYGRFKETEFTVDKPIDRHPKDRKRMAIVADGRRAVTHVSVLRQYDDCALLRCCLETGRTHQIRVHLSTLGHPIAGDPVYGVKTDRLAKKYSLNGQLLHAAMLGFVHPDTQEYIEFSTPVPPYFQAILDDLER